MKKIILGIIAFLFVQHINAQSSSEYYDKSEKKASFKYEYKIVTVVESIIPMGLGRSRILEEDEDVDSEDYTTERKAGTDSKQNRVKRRNLRIKNLKETKLLNFYSGIGLNFQNIASNDAIISSKINDLAEQGWELQFVITGVESKAGKDDSDGIFITRFIFRRSIE